MAKQTFTTGQVLSAAQMTSLQQTAMGGGSTTAKTASYTLVAADAGTVVQMNSASATTITVNTGLFAAGDTVQIQNVGAGVCTVTAGTATVNTAGSLALSQYEGGQLYFNTTSAALFFDTVQSAAAGGKVLQVVQGTTSTPTAVASTTYTDTALTATITPSLASSKVLCLVSQNFQNARAGGAADGGSSIKLVRGATDIVTRGTQEVDLLYNIAATTSSATNFAMVTNIMYVDSPSTTSATTYKTQGSVRFTANSNAVTYQTGGSQSQIILLEIGA